MTVLVWRTLSTLVAEHGAAALVSVQDARGSTPREAGAALAVRPDGAFHGTIGGGRLEWEALRAARAALAAGRGPARWLDHVLGPDLGQCCGGRVTLRVETFDGRDGGELAWLAEAEEGGSVVEAHSDEAGRIARRPIAASLPPGDPGGGKEAQPPGATEASARATLPPLRGRDSPRSGQGEGASGVGRDGPDPPAPSSKLSGLTSPRPLSLPALRQAVPPPRRGEGRALRWTESLGEPRTPLLLFGAGHVGRALVLALAPLPFAVRWIDGRDDAFPAHVPANAHPVHASDPTAEAERAPPGAFILVMTHDHALDLALTAAALDRSDLPFVGLIGSATKRARFERRFREIGLGPARIAALRCPIGLPGLPGKEPAVIAASVAAQLLIERAQAPRLLRAKAHDLVPA